VRGRHFEKIKRGKIKGRMDEQKHEKQAGQMGGQTKRCREVGREARKEPKEARDKVGGRGRLG